MRFQLMFIEQGAFIPEIEFPKKSLVKENERKTNLTAKDYLVKIIEFLNHQPPSMATGGCRVGKKI